MLKKIKTKIRKNLKVIEKIGLATTSLLFYTNTCFAGVGDSKLATGTTNLINDLTNWLLIVAPILTVLLVGYYLLRKSYTYPKKVDLGYYDWGGNLREWKR